MGFLSAGEYHGDARGGVTSSAMASDRTAAKKHPPRRGRRFLRGALFGFLLIIVAGLSMLAGFYVAVDRSLSSPLDLASARGTAQTTRIFDASESPTLLAELHGVENRQILSGEEVPQVMRDAVVAIEDERFYIHQGVDFLGILRAAWANVRKREIVQGGSTITQQYIKNAYITDDQTLDRKLREAALAYQLEKQWSKEKILNEYLNIIYFGEGAYGIEAAAQEYFGVSRGRSLHRPGGAARRTSQGPFRLLAPARPGKGHGQERSGPEQPCSSSATSRAPSSRRPWTRHSSSPRRARTKPETCPTGWRWCGNNWSTVTVPPRFWAEVCRCT